MVVALGSVAVALGILVASNAAAVDAWTIPPSTYLAICTAIANLAVRFAAIQGVAIAWWSRALRKGGSSLADLHRAWRASTLSGPVAAGRHMGLMGVASIFSILVTMDGPLLQRASTIRVAPITGVTTPLNVSMSPEVPRNTFGFWYPAEAVYFITPWSHTFNDTVPTALGSANNSIYTGAMAGAFAFSVEKQFQADSAMTGIIEGCPGTCLATIQAPALEITACTQHTMHVDYGAPVSVRVMKKNKTPPLNQDQFFISLGLDVEGARESIYLVTGHSQTDTCAGTLTWNACNLEAAIGKYNVSITADVVHVQNMGSPRVIARANNTAIDHHLRTDGTRLSTLGLVVSQAWLKWDTVLTLRNVSGVVANEERGASPWSPFIYNANDLCPSFHNPQSTVLASLNELMFRSGAAAAAQNASEQENLLSKVDPELSFHTAVTGSVQGTQPVYRTEYWYFFGAAVVEVVVVALIACTFWGWWQIGWPVSFSPLEMAKAFEALILSSCNSNSSGRDLAKAVGDYKVQYGATSMPYAEKLAFRDPAIVTVPTKGVYYSA